MIPKLAGYELPIALDLPKNKVSWEVDSKRAVLLIHDMQEYFLDFWGEESDFVQQLVANIIKLKKFCKTQGIPVYYTAQPINQKPEDRMLLNDMWGAGIDKMPERQSIVSQLAPEKDDIELVKWRYSAFQKSDFQKQLKDSNRDQLIICGVYAHIGCITTATDAFMMDIKPFFVADALADFSRDKHDYALSVCAECCGIVTMMKDLNADLVNKDIKSVIFQALDGNDEEWPEDDDNLVDYGVNSVQIMNLAGRWRSIYPNIDFVKLAQTPSIKKWKELLLSEV